MGFFTGYTEARVGGLLAGLGNLTARGSTAASAEAKRIVQSFIEGRPAHGSCSGSGDARHCGIVSTGHSLRTETYLFAERSKADPTRVTFCVPARAAFDEKGKETQESKDVRAVASALLSKLKTGVGVKTGKEGDRRLVGRKGRARVVLPGQCLEIRIPKSEGREAEYGLQATAELVQELKREPNKREWAAGKARVRARASELKATVAAEKRERAKLLKRLERDVAARRKAAEAMEFIKATAASGVIPRPSIPMQTRAGISLRAKAANIARAKVAQAQALKKRIVGP